MPALHEHTPIRQRLGELLFDSRRFCAAAATNSSGLVAAHSGWPTARKSEPPTRAALECISHSESFDRGWYAGAIGWFDALGDGDFNVALRSGLVRSERAWLFAGVGLVRESKAELEYAETTWKLTTMLSSLRARR